MKILIIADEEARKKSWFSMFNTPELEIEPVQTVFEANDLFLSGLALGQSYPLVVFHHGQNSADALQLIKYWRIQEPSIAVLYVCKDRADATENLKDIGIIDTIVEDEGVDILKNHFRFLLQGTKDRQILGIKTQILEDPANLNDPANAVSKALAIIVNQSAIGAAAFVQFTDKQEEPILQIANSLDMTDQLWLDDLCSNAEDSLLKYLQDKRMQVIGQRYLFPIYSSRGWEGLLIFILKEDRAVNPTDLESLAKTMHFLLERVRVNQELQRKISEKTTYISLLSDTLKSSLKESAQQLELLKIITLEEKALELTTKAENQVTRGIYLLNDIVELARIDDGLMVLLSQPVDLFERIQHAVKQVIMSAEEKQIDIQYENCSEAPIIIDADIKKMEQVFYNLLFFLVQNSEKNDCIKVSVFEGSKGLTFVKLSGMIHTQTRSDYQKLFERPESGYLLDENKVSLFICKKFINAHEGKIYAELHEHSGFSFIIQLPTKVV